MSEGKPDPEKVTISAGELGMLAYCAVSYDRRLDNGRVPGHIWELLPQEWRDRINGATGRCGWEERSLGDRLLAVLTRDGAE